MPAGGRFTIAAIFKGVDRISSPITRGANAVMLQSRRMRKALGKVDRTLKRVGKTAKSAFGVAGIAGVVAGAALALGAVVTKGADFEQALVGAGARFRDEFNQPIIKGTELFERLGKEARKVGAETEFTATQAAGGLEFLAKAGFSAQSSLKLLNPIVDLATASGLDLARAADIASDALGAFGKGDKDPTTLQRNFIDLSDKMAKTVNTANLGMEELFETIKKGAPSATAAGVPMETFLALTGQLSNAGLKASDAGTALKNVFLQIAKPSVQRDFARLGVSVKDLGTGEMRDFADILEDLQKSIGSESKITQAGILDQLFGKRGITAVSTILSTGIDRFRAYRDAVSDAAGTTRQMAAILRDTVRGELNTMSSAIEGLTLSLFAANAEGFSALIEGVTTAARAMQQFSDQNQELVGTTGKVLGVGVLALVIAGLTTLLALGLSAIGLPGLIAGAVTAAVAVIISQLDNIKKWFTDFFASNLFEKALRLAAFALPGNFTFMPGEAAPGSDTPFEFPNPPPRSEGSSFASSLQEIITKSENLLTIRDETGRAELDKRPVVAGGLRLNLESSGLL